MHDDDDPTMEFNREHLEQLIGRPLEPPQDGDTDVRANPEASSTLVTRTDQAVPEVDVTSDLPEPPLPLARHSAADATRPAVPAIDTTAEVRATGPHPQVRRSSAGLIAGLVGLVIVVVLVLGAAALLVPRLLGGTTVSFQVQPADLEAVEITVDGQVMYRGPSKNDIVLESFPPGSRVVTVRAKGFLPKSDTVEVRRGANVLYPVALEAVPPAVVTKLRLEITPAGAVLMLDGGKVSAVDGQSLEDVSPGSHTLVVSKLGYVERRLEFSLGPGESKTLTVVLEPARFSLRVKARRGVQVEVFRIGTESGERVSVSKGRAPLQAEGLDGTARYDIVPGGGWLAVVGWRWDGKGPGLLQLEEAPVVAKAPPVAKPKNPKPREKPPLVVNNRPDPKPKGTGTLVVAAKPQARIYVDGKSYGYTPKTNIKVSAGRHRVKLVMESISKTKTYTVNVKPNQTVRVIGRP
jgi:hypothetical protein